MTFIVNSKCKKLIDEIKEVKCVPDVEPVRRFGPPARMGSHATCAKWKTMAGPSGSAKEDQSAEMDAAHKAVFRALISMATDVLAMQFVLRYAETDPESLKEILAEMREAE